MEEKSEQSSTKAPSIDALSQEELLVDDAVAAAPIESSIDPPEEEEKVEETPRSSARQGRQSQITQANLAAQIEKEKRRILGYPDMASQLINQLILQNNNRIMQASAAPPSGSG